MSRVGEIEARLAAATDAPWFVERELIMDATRERTIVIVGCGDDDPQVERDAELIRSAPEDLRWCLDRITEAELFARYVLRSWPSSPTAKTTAAAWLESVSTETPGGV